MSKPSATDVAAGKDLKLETAYLGHPSKLVVRITDGGQVTLHYKDGKWTNPSLVGTKFFNKVSASYDTLHTRKGCRETCQYIVTEMLNAGEIEPSQETVTSVCREIGIAGRLIGGKGFDWIKRGRGACTMHVYPKVPYSMQKVRDFDMDHWSKPRVLAALRTCQYLFAVGQTKGDAKLVSKAEMLAAGTLLKAGALIHGEHHSCEELSKALLQEEDVQGSYIDNDGDLLIQTAESLFTDSETLLQVTARLEPNLRWEQNKPNEQRFTATTLPVLALYLAAHPECSAQTMQTASDIVRRMTSLEIRNLMNSKIHAYSEGETEKMLVWGTGFLKVADRDARHQILSRIAKVLDMQERQLANIDSTPEEKRTYHDRDVWRTATFNVASLHRFLDHMGIKREELPPPIEDKAW